jgi:hypothetical protein
MMFPLLSLLAAAAASQPPPTVDQTPDALLLLRFVDAVKRGDDREARSLLAPTAFLGDYAQRNRSSYEALAAYARACRLKEIRLVNSRRGSRMPIGVEFVCPHPDPDRFASFWFEGSRISRIGWGTPPMVRVPQAR